MYIHCFVCPRNMHRAAACMTPAQYSWVKKLGEPTAPTGENFRPPTKKKSFTSARVASPTLAEVKETNSLIVSSVCSFDDPGLFQMLTYTLVVKVKISFLLHRPWHKLVRQSN